MKSQSIIVVHSTFHSLYISISSGRMTLFNVTKMNEQKKKMKKNTQINLKPACAHRWHYLPSPHNLRMSELRSFSVMLSLKGSYQFIYEMHCFRDQYMTLFDIIACIIVPSKLLTIHFTVTKTFYTRKYSLTSVV